MARFKPVDTSPRFLPVVLEQQIQPGTFEHALHVLIDTEFDLAPLHAKYINDDTGAPAYDPAVLLKIVLLAYSRGLISSRAIERACRENVLFMAISGDTQPAYTTIAAFIRHLGDQIADIFTEVILICDAINAATFSGGTPGRPPLRPRARAAASPAFVRSRDVALELSQRRGGVNNFV